MSNNLNISCDISPWSKAIKGYWICVSSLCKSWRRTIGSMPSSRLLWILSLSRSIGSRRPTDRQQNIKMIQNGIRLKSNVLLSSQIALTASYENRSYIIRLRIVVPVPNLDYCTIAGTRKTRSEKNHANSYQRSKQGPVVQVLWLLQSNWPVAFLELFSSFCVCSRQVSVNPNFHKHLQETAEEGAHNNFDTSYWAWISLPNQASKIWLSIFVPLHQDSLLGHRKNERRHILLQFCCCTSRFFWFRHKHILNI